MAYGNKRGVSRGHCCVEVILSLQSRELRSCTHTCCKHRLSAFLLPACGLVPFTWRASIPGYLAFAPCFFTVAPLNVQAGCKAITMVNAWWKQRDPQPSARLRFDWVGGRGTLTFLGPFRATARARSLAIGSTFDELWSVTCPKATARRQERIRTGTSYKTYFTKIPRPQIATLRR